MNYWTARGYLKTAERFEQLTMEYWSKLPEQNHYDGISRLKYQDTEASLAVRMQISHSLPLIEEVAHSLGVSFTAHSYPAPAVGGPVLPVNIFRSVIEPEIGHSTIDRNLIIDTIVKTKVLAGKQCHSQLIHMLLPWNWVIDFCALAIRFPFIILKRAGLPSAIENNIVSQIIKILGTIILISFLVYKGVSLSGIGITELLKIFTK